MALVAGAVAACVVTMVIVDRGGAFALARGTSAVAIEVGAALALIVAGVIALVRRRPFALLVVALGAAWAMREWANPAAPNALVFTLGLLLGTIWLPLTGWLALAYSRALPERRRDRCGRRHRRRRGARARVLACGDFQPAEQRMPRVSREPRPDRRCTFGRAVGG